MMTYIQNYNSGRGRNTRKFVYIVFILIVAAFTLRIFMPNITSGFFTAIARPFWRIEFSVNSGQLKSNEQLLSENQELSRKLDAANIDLKSASILIAENDQLKSLMGRSSTTPSILAAVLQRPPTTVYDELIIDVGADIGVTIGNVVYAANSIPIGKITDVLSHSSKVVLFSSPGQTYNVLIGKSNIPATGIGRGGGQYSAELPRTANVSQGDFVSVPGIKTNLYGIVQTILADPSLPFETIIFAAPVNIYQLKWVYVEKK